MTRSDWGEWLPRAVESADPDSVAVWYLGCNGFILKGSGGTTVAIDPYLGTGDPPRTVRMIPVPFDPDDITEMDAVFATHEHTDHTHGPSQAPILASTGASFYAPDDSVSVALDAEAWPANYDVDGDQLTNSKASVGQQRDHRLITLLQVVGTGRVARGSKTLHLLRFQPCVSLNFGFCVFVHFVSVCL